MVAVSSPAKVLVTGANGYLAVWVVKKYLEAGYSVRGTVRSLSKSTFLTEKFSNHGDQFELVVVEDITKDGAFDEAVKGVDVIAHTASPFHFKATSPDGMSFHSYQKSRPPLPNAIHPDIITPAVRGTTSILNSALKHGSNVKRLVLTSSVVAVREPTAVPRAFTESDWNNADVEAVKTKGAAAGPVAMYMASKSLAEKAAWEFIAAHKSEISWDLVAINPPYIFGASFSISPSFHCPPPLTGSTHIYSRLSPPRRRSMTSTPLSVNSMTLFLALGQVRNCGLRATGYMWQSSPRHMCGLRMRLLLEESASSSDLDPTLSRTSVSCIFPSYPIFGDLT